MNIKPFAVEEWMNEYEVGALYNIAETCVDSVSLDELFELTGENKEDFLKDFCAQRLTYGDIWGSEALRSGISKLYHTIKADEVVLTHGAAGANPSRILLAHFRGRPRGQHHADLSAALLHPRGHPRGRRIMHLSRKTTISPT